MSGRPVKILHCVGAMARGGIENWLMDVMRNIDRGEFGFDFLVHTLRGFAVSHCGELTVCRRA